MEKTTAELCRETIEGWEKTIDEVVPVYFLSGFIFGSKRNKKELKYLFEKGKLKKPLGVEFLDGILGKGVKIVGKTLFGIICQKCGKEHTKTGDLKFCSSCGNSLESHIFL